MPELGQITVYEIKISGVFWVKAANSIDAINKAKEWVEENSGKLDYAWIAQAVFVEPEE